MSAINGNGGVSLNHMTSLPIKGFNQLTQLSKKMWNGIASAGITPTQVELIAELIAGAALTFILLKAIQKLSQANLFPSKSTTPLQKQMIMPNPLWEAPKNKVTDLKELMACFSAYTRDLGGSFSILRGSIFKDDTDNKIKIKITDYNVQFQFPNEVLRNLFLARLDQSLATKDWKKTAGQMKTDATENVEQKTSTRTYTLTPHQAYAMANLTPLKDEMKHYEGWIKNWYFSRANSDIAMSGSSANYIVQEVVHESKR